MTAEAEARSAADDPEPPARPARPPLTTVLVAAALLAVLVALSVRRSLALANTDSLLYALMSTERLTPYYWGQDRLLNLVPALAWPIQQVRWNYLAQTTLLAASFFLLIGSFVRFHATRVRDVVSWPMTVASATVTGALALALLDRWGTYTFVLEQQYALSTLLFLSGIAWLTDGSISRRAMGVAAMVAATMLIPSTVLLFPAVVVMRPGAGAIRRAALVGAVAVAAFGTNSLAAHLLADDSPSSDAYADFSLNRMRIGFPHAASSIAHSTNTVATLVVAAAAVAVLVARRRRLEPSLLAAYALCPVVALAWVALFSANAWVEMNIFLFRYFFVAYAAALLVLAGAVTECCRWAAERVGPGRAFRPVSLQLAAVAATAAVAASVVVVAGTDIPVVDAGEQVADVARDRDVDLVVGDYWQAWPAMFAATDRGDDLLVASARSQALRDRIIALADDGPVGALCLSGDVTTCSSDVSAVTALTWTVGSVRSTDPLVVDLVPAG